MEAWGRLARAGLAPPELGAPPRALRDPSGAWSSPGAAAGAPRANDGMVWVWEQLWSLRRMDLQLFNQLCILGLEIQALREETGVDLDEEGEGLGASPTDWLIPDFEITI
ncbi:glutamate-rich protein 4 [Phascolarctos cinereus]|uniref:Glutamate-rich protein 4 n=1 Tax=Phascolarctos cinereus TaxID=38626 RepID=A0A6P5JS19_PHACI|nr:glutamate-rich protein 4 [Phascolarctos cinereus]